jgi:hypothetical protein
MAWLVVIIIRNCVGDHVSKQPVSRLRVLSATFPSVLG